MYPESKEILQDRALLFSKVRSFFAQRNILEVDTPLLSHFAPIDEHIDVMEVSLGEGKQGYLHTSPEYAMKRLLSSGLGEIFQLSHVFRKGEISNKHNPEFTMIEWYRLHEDFPLFIEETLDLIRLFLSDLPSSFLSYRQTFLRFAKIDYLHASKEELIHCLKSHGIDPPSSPLDKDTLLTLILGCIIEPHLGKEELFVLMDYPISQAALAQAVQKGEERVAKRFEVYYQGIELANGYLELTEAKEQRSRLIESNAKRLQQGKNSLPIDEFFLAALEKGLPPCCGVAVGFDRLMQLRHKTETIQEVLPFGWSKT